MYYYKTTDSNVSDGSYLSRFTYNTGNRVDKRSDQKGDPIWVHLSEKKIEFYIEIKDINKPVNLEYSEVIFEIPLEDPQETRQALLNPDNIKGWLEIATENPKYVLYHTRHLPYRNFLEVPGYPKRHTLYELILTFIYELNYSNGVFMKNQPELANEILVKLEKCGLYRLIRYKYRFYYSVHEWLDSGKANREEKKMKNTFNIYLNEIIDGSIQNEVPGRFMGKNYWFDIPEKELEYLAEVNNKFDIEPERNEHIQKALLARHAVAAALRTTNINSAITILLQFATATLYCSVIILWFFNIYKYTFFLLLLGVILYISALSIQISQQKGKINTFLPRILVAIASGWFLFLVSDELITHPMTLSAENTISLLLFGLFILFMFIYAEVRNVSPYLSHQNKGKIRSKTFLIIVLTFNLTTTIGLFLHPVVVSNLVEKSPAMITQYNSAFNDHANTIIKVEHYRDKLLLFQSSSSSSLLAMSDDSLTQIINGNLLGLFNVSGHLSKGFKYDTNAIIALHQGYNNRIRLINEALSADSILLRALKGFDSLQARTFDTIPFPLKMNHSVPIKESIISKLSLNDKRINPSINLCELILSKLSKEKETVMEENYFLNLNTFQDSISFQPITIDSNPAKLPNPQFKIDISSNKLTEGFYKRIGHGKNKKSQGTLSNEKSDKQTIDNDNKHYVCIQIKYKTFFIRLFPQMLIFHVILIMLIGIVSSLIISERTVTESL